MTTNSLDFSSPSKGVIPSNSESSDNAQTPTTSLATQVAQTIISSTPNSSSATKTPSCKPVGSPYPNGTPEQFARLVRTINGKPLRERPSTTDKKIISESSSIIDRQKKRTASERKADENRRNDEDDPNDHLFKRLSNRLTSTVHESPSKTHEEAVQTVGNSSWAGPLSKTLYTNMTLSGQMTAAGQYLNVKHLEEATTNGAGFHICASTDPRWNNMTNIRQSIRGAVSATFPTDKNGTKFSTFFPPETFPSKSEVTRSFSRANILFEFSPVNSSHFLYKDETSGLVLEKRVNEKSPMLATTLYPVFTFLRHSDWNGKAAIPISKECTLGGKTSSPVAVAAREIDLASRNAITKFMIGVNKHNPALYESDTEVILEISKEMPSVGVPHGLYVGYPKDRLSEAQCLKLKVQEAPTL